jgi:hypothetical protein
MSASPHHPTNDLVAVAWLKAYVPEFVGASGTVPEVGTVLPADVTAWAAHGFVQCVAIPAGRRPNIDVPLRHPVFQLDGWAATPGSKQPPWGMANDLLESVRLAIELNRGLAFTGKLLTVKAGYRQVRIQAAYLINDIARIPDDPSGYARYSTDLAIDWVPA